jgi:hypothetical protein
MDKLPPGLYPTNTHIYTLSAHRPLPSRPQTHPRPPVQQVWFTPQRILVLAWGHHIRFSCNRVQDALTMLAPTTTLTTHHGPNHRDKQPPADHDLDGTRVLNIQDNGLHLPQQGAAITKQLPQLYGTASTNFRAPSTHGAPS